MKRKYFLFVMCSLLAGCCLMFSSCDLKNKESHGTTEPSGTDTEVEAKEPVRYSTELYDVDGNSVIFKKADGYRMKLIFNKDSMVRIRFAPGSSDFLPDDTVTEAISMQDGDYAYIAPVLEEKDEKITVSTSEITVEVSKSDYSLIFFDRNGKILTQTAKKPFSVKGEGKKFSLVLDACGTEEHFFGLGADPGLSYTTTDHRGKTFSLWLDENNVQGITPLYYSTAGYGIYLHNSNKGTVSFLDKDYSINIDGGEMDCYFIYGPSFENILYDFTELSGFMNMPPLYSLGLSVASANEANATAILNNIKTLYNADIKFDTVAEVVGWQTARYPCSYLWNNNFTTNPEDFINKAHALGVHLVFWGHPYVSPTSPIYNTIAPYSLLGSDIGARIWGDGTLAYGFGGMVPDLTLKEARDIYWNIQDEKLFSLGIDGAWIDETDSWICDNSLTTVFPSGLTANAYHNLLGTLTANLTHERIKEQYGKRSFVYCRGNYTGQQKYATVSYTDYYEFDQFLMGVIGQGYSGTYFTPEIRNAQTPSDVDYQRRIQLLFLTPFPRNNEWIDGQLVTSRSKTVQDTYRKYNSLHYSLIPYTYSCFWEQHNTGLGIIRPLPLAFYGDEGTYTIDNEYMYGDSLLVCPVNSKAKISTTSIYLPSGYDWYDYNSGYVFEGGKTIQYSSASDTLPLFVKMGSIIPMKHYGNNTEELVDENIDIDIYPSESKAEFDLYEDDGISYEYENGIFALTSISVVKSNSKITFTSEKREGGFKIADRFCTLKIHYRCEPDSVTLNGTEMKKVGSADALNGNTEGWFYSNSSNDSEKIIYVRYKDDGEKKTVTVTAGNEDAQTVPKVLEEEYETPMEGTLYECESKSTEFYDCAGIIYTQAADGGAAVYGVMKQGYIVMNGITAPEDGLYRARLKYLSGADKLKCHISVNNGKDFVVFLYSTGGWGVTGYVDMLLPLKKGENSIRFFGLMEEDGVPYLDSLKVSDAKPFEGSVLESIDLSKAKISSGIKAVKCTTSTSGVVYGPFKNSSDRIGFDIIKPGENDGSSSPFMIEITYSNPDINEKQFLMNVNGTDYMMVLPSTYGYEQFATVTQTIYLNNGKNTVLISPNGNQGVDLGIGEISVS